jgi:hypothetical protein
MFDAARSIAFIGSRGLSGCEIMADCLPPDRPNAHVGRLPERPTAGNALPAAISPPWIDKTTALQSETPPALLASTRRVVPTALAEAVAGAAPRFDVEDHADPKLTVFGAEQQAPPCARRNSRTLRRFIGSRKALDTHLTDFSSPVGVVEQIRCRETKVSV